MNNFIGKKDIIIINLLGKKIYYCKILLTVTYFHSYSYINDKLLFIKIILFLKYSNTKYYKNLIINVNVEVSSDLFSFILSRVVVVHFDQPRPHFLSNSGNASNYYYYYYY